jgi:hypothetical protein
VKLWKIHILFLWGVRRYGHTSQPANLYYLTTLGNCLPLVSKLFKPRKALSQRVIEKCIGILRETGASWVEYGSGRRKVPLCFAMDNGSGVECQQC